MSNPYEVPLTSFEEVKVQPQPPMWRRAVAAAVRLMSYVLSIFVAMLSLTAILGVIEPIRVEHEWSVVIPIFVSIASASVILWLAGALAKWIAKETSG